MKRSYSTVAQAVQSEPPLLFEPVQAVTCFVISGRHFSDENSVARLRLHLDGPESLSRRVRPSRTVQMLAASK